MSELLPAGRELDARIAKVMGWTAIRKEGAWVGGLDLTGGTDTIPYYSIDMAAAWPVWIEMLTRVGQCEIVGDMENFCDGPGDIVTVRIWDGEDGAYTVTGDAPWAICNCALLVLGEISL